MKTCTQISKINVVSPGDSTKPMPARVGGLAFPIGQKHDVKSSPLGRASPTKRAGPPPYKHPPRNVLLRINRNKTRT